MPLKVECKGIVTEEGRMRCENFAFKEIIKEELPIDFGYSLFFEF